MEVRTSFAEGHNDVRIVGVGGRIAADTITQLENALTAVLEEGVNKVIIDLGEVDYISSAGLRVILSTLKSVKTRNGILILANLKPNIERIFTLAGFKEILTIMEDVSSAVNATQR